MEKKKEILTDMEIPVCPELPSVQLLITTWLPYVTVNALVRANIICKF